MPTILERPRTTTSLPATSILERCNNSTHPAGVQLRGVAWQGNARQMALGMQRQAGKHDGDQIEQAVNQAQVAPCVS
eukprot:scaffold318872_cov33-Tisochrysis_lutea.AAC.2